MMRFCLRTSRDRARLALPAAILLLIAVGPVTAAEPDSPAPAPLPVADWLVAGPAAAPLPAFREEREGKFGVNDLLGAGALDARRLAPRAGGPTGLRDGGPWRAAGGAEAAFVAPSGDAPAEAYVATYLTAARWLEATLRLEGAHPAKVWLDGAALALAAAKPDSGAAPGAPAPAAQTAELKLEPGGHLLVVQTVLDPGKDEPWRVAASLAPAAGTPEGALGATLDPRRPQTVRDVLDAPSITSAALAPDGRRVIVALAANDAAGRRETWLELRRTEDGALERSWRGGVQMGRVRWAGSSARFSYTSDRDGKDTIWLHDLAAGTTEAVARDVAEMGDYRWSRDGRALVYEFTVKSEPDKRKVQRLESIEDRQPGWRDRTQLVLVAWPGGAQRRLTAGEWSAEGWSLSPDGARLLLFRERPDYAERPYAHRELWELDLGTLSATKILEDRWIQSAAYGPEPDVLLLQGSPSAFDGLGRDVPEGAVANDYGGQVYLFDRRTGAATPLSRDFDPDVQRLAWHAREGRVCAQVVEGQLQSLYTLAPGPRPQWTRLDTGLEVVDEFDLATDAPLAIAAGSGAATPQRLVLVDLRRGRPRVLLEPAAERNADLALGRVEDWAAHLPGGEVLDGRVYYPTDYDPSRRYPCIVYYYGGTSPVGRDFGGRYPKNVWAGQGYFVYVPQPSGATGYGQEFAARHVNDWGLLTADEVIGATRAFLAAHPAVDPARLACIGASYGGFLTEYLLTRTDMFACGISHAGISSIASYWGEGYWGYVYGARALADAFPWSRRDVYVERSPLFNADRIRTPLLLLHGTADTNVPPGESEQLYTALKLLGREVEYVRIEGQNHHVLDRDQRIVWNDTILAWFARWLKDEPGWWRELYPD